jgi:hypothetical protein
MGRWVQLADFFVARHELIKALTCIKSLRGLVCEKQHTSESLGFQGLLGVGRERMKSAPEPTNPDISQGSVRFGRKSPRQP